jgi:hypothetical protein
MPSAEDRFLALSARSWGNAVGQQRIDLARSRVGRRMAAICAQQTAALDG